MGQHSDRALDLIAEHAAKMIVAGLKGDTKTADAERRRAQMVANNTRRT